MVWANSTQIGECQRMGIPTLESYQIESYYPVTLKFRCYYECRLSDTDTELVEARYELKAEDESDLFDKFSCEGDYDHSGIFFSRLSISEDLKRWANDNNISYEGPYKGKLTQETLANLLDVGRKLAATKSVIASRAGNILIKIGLQTEEGQKLFDEYLTELRSAGVQQSGMQTPDDWVLHYIIQYGRHLY